MQSKTASLDLLIEITINLFFFFFVVMVIFYKDIHNVGFCGFVVTNSHLTNHIKVISIKYPFHHVTANVRLKPANFHGFTKKHSASNQLQA